MCRAVVARCQSALVVALVVFVVAQTAVLPVGGQSIVSVDKASSTEFAGDYGVDSGTAQSDVVVQQSTPSNNTTPVRHQDPDTVSESGDLDAVERHLSRQLSQRLSDSAVEIEQGEYERARALLGSEYDDSLEQYVTVADATGNEAAAETLQTATRQQRSFVNETREYQDTRAAYEQAKRDGDQQRARELARQLERQSENVTRRGVALGRTYDTVENRTGADLTEAETATENVIRTVERQQAEIRETEFTETRLQLTADRHNISFAEPLVFEGRLETAAGVPVANRTIVLQVGEDRMRVDTNASGRFSVTYRPRTLPLSATDMAVTYVPETTAPYLGTEARIPIVIDRQVAATIRLEHTPQTVAYNDSVAVSGVVQATARPVSDVPVRVRVGETRLGTVRTDSDGRFRVNARFPAAASSGEQSITVAYPLTERAVAATSTQTSVTVESTATTLSINADRTGSDEALITGRLRTTDGHDIAGQSVAIQTDGTTHTVVETNATGWYQASVPVETEPGSHTTIEARFERPTTNLESTSATTRLSTPARGEDSSGLLWFGVGAILLGVIGTAAWSVWQRRMQSPVGSMPDAPSTTISDATDRTSRSKRLLEAAESTVNDDPNAAVRLAYGALRSALIEDLSSAEAQTHWEFYHACREAGLLDSEGALRTFTEWYEQAAYSQASVDQATAEQALETAQHVTQDRLE